MFNIYLEYNGVNKKMKFESNQKNLTDQKLKELLAIVFGLNLKNEYKIQNPQDNEKYSIAQFLLKLAENEKIQNQHFKIVLDNPLKAKIIKINGYSHYNQKIEEYSDKGLIFMICINKKELKKFKHQIKVLAQRQENLYTLIYEKYNQFQDDLLDQLFQLSSSTCIFIYNKQILIELPINEESIEAIKNVIDLLFKSIQNKKEEDKDSYSKFGPIDMLKKLFDDGAISELEFYYMQSLFLEKNALIHDFIQEPILLNDYLQFSKKVQQFLRKHSHQIYQTENQQRPLSPTPEREISNRIKQLVKQNIFKNQEQFLEVINNLINQHNELLFASYDMYLADQEGDEFLDTLNRIVENELKNQNKDKQVIEKEFTFSEQNLQEKKSPYQKIKQQEQLLSPLKSSSQQQEHDELDIFGNDINKQLNIVYAIQEDINIAQYNTLCKMINNGNTELLKLYYVNRMNGDKYEFINKAINLANSFFQQEIKFEQVQKVERRKQIFNQIFNKKKLQQMIKHTQLILKSIEENNSLINSIFEIYECYSNKFEFIENIVLIYRKFYKDCFKIFISEKLPIEYKEENESNLIQLIEQQNNVLMSAFEVYMVMSKVNIMEAEQELIDTLKRYISIFMAKQV